MDPPDQTVTFDDQHEQLLMLRLSGRMQRFGSSAVSSNVIPLIDSGLSTFNSRGSYRPQQSLSPHANTTLKFTAVKPPQPDIESGSTPYEYLINLGMSSLAATQKLNDAKAAAAKQGQEIYVFEHAADRKVSVAVGVKDKAGRTVVSFKPADVVNVLKAYIPELSGYTTEGKA